MITYRVDEVDSLHHCDGVWKEYKDTPSGDKEQQYSKKLFESSDLEEAKVFAAARRNEWAWGNGNCYITLDKYEDGKLLETIEF